MNNTNNNLKPMFDGRVLMNETAIHDQAVMNALQSCSLNNFEFKHTWHGDHVTFDQLINPTD